MQKKKKKKLTTFIEPNREPLTRRFLPLRTAIRMQDSTRNIDEGRIDNTVSSKRRVKSNSRTQLSTTGPKVLSTDGGQADSDESLTMLLFMSLYNAWTADAGDALW
jgi:hypothetical protein